MKVILQLIVSRDGYIAGIGDDLSWIADETREKYTRTIRGIGNCIIGRRAYQALQTKKIFDHCGNPFVVVVSKHNYPSQPDIHFTHAKPKNILRFLDEKGRSSTVVCGGVETAGLFIEAGLVDMVLVYQEDGEAGDGIKLPSILLEKFQCIDKKQSARGSTEKLYMRK